MGEGVRREGVQAGVGSMSASTLPGVDPVRGGCPEEVRRIFVVSFVDEAHDKARDEA